MNVFNRYGYFVTKNSYFLCYDPVKMTEVFTEMRNNNNYTPKCGDFAIKDIRDLTTGYDSSVPDKKPLLPSSTSSHMVART